MPHVGTFIPQSLRRLYTPRALTVEDTDWHLARLYGFAAELGAALLVPTHSRYVVDLNRSSDNAPMYPGQNNTELCPTRHFSGDPIYLPGCAPNDEQVRERVDTFWQPYHDALAKAVQAAVAQHGHCVLFDAHSIQSRLPWLFEGTLPHLNLGTANGSSCAASLRECVATVAAAAAPAYSHVVDGRFKGGHITRQYGRPEAGVHAVQLEMTFSAYMHEAPPWAWDDARAAGITPVLRYLVQAMIDWRP